jgi:hypothetical protein
VHRYHNASACVWYWGTSLPASGWTDEGVAFRAAPGGTVVVQQLFNSSSLGRPLTTDPSAWNAVGGYSVEEPDVVHAFGSSQPGARKITRYRWIAPSTCNTAGWARYLSTIDPNEQPSGSTVSTTPPGVTTVDTDMWVCPP